MIYKQTSLGEIMKTVFEIRLWSINRILRYTGFRFFVTQNTDGTGEFVSIGLRFYGWKGIK